MAALSAAHAQPVRTARLGRIVVGGRGLAEGKLELKARTDTEATHVPLEGAADHVRDLVTSAGGRLVPDLV